MYSSCSFSFLLDHKATVFEAENRTVVFHEHRENLLFFGVVLGRTSIDEDILLAIVAVDVAAEANFPFLLGLPDEHFGEVDGRMCLFGRLNPLPVEIGS